MENNNIDWMKALNHPLNLILREEEKTKDRLVRLKELYGITEYHFVRGLNLDVDELLKREWRP